MIVGTKWQVLSLLVLLQFSKIVYTQDLVDLAIEVDKRSDSIVVYYADTALLYKLLDRELITEKDTAQLAEMAHFVKDPWDNYDLDQFDLALIDSLWKYKNLGIPERTRGLVDSGAPVNPFGTAAENRQELFYPGDLSDFAPVPSITSRIIEGTADFIADRFKKELAITFFDNFRERVIADSLFRLLLPQTSNLLIYQDISFFLNIGETERSAFRNDLEHMLVNFERFVNTSPRYANLSEDIHFRAFMLALKTVDYSVKGYGISELLSIYHLQEQQYEDPLGVGVRLLYVFLGSLSNGNFQDLPMVFRNVNRLSSTRQRAYFAAMALQDDLRLIEILEIDDESMEDYWGEVDQLLEEFLLLAENLRDQHQTLVSKSREGQLDNQAMLDYAVYAFDIIDLAARFAYLKAPEKYQKSELFQTALPVARKTIRVSQAIDEGDIGLVLLNASSIVADLLDLGTPVSERQTAGYVVREILLKYGNFMVNVLNARNSKAVDQAIEAVALPPGAARIKRQTLQSISLNAFPGGYGGVEWLSNNGKTTSAAGNLGFTAPIGLSFNWGLSRKLEEAPVPYGTSGGGFLLSDAKDHEIVVGYEQTYLKDSTWRRLTGHSISIFISVIDLGAAVSYRLSNDPTEGLPDDITLRQIISPGAFMVYGIKNTPISIMGGVQYTPELREISRRSITFSSNTLRVFISLNVDIPFINLYVK